MTEKYLNEFLGTLGVLYIKLHQYHWYVEGENFFTLHERFEEYYDETTSILDEVAERMLALEYNPVSTLKEFLDVSWIQETSYRTLTSREMVQEVLKDFTTLSHKLQEGLDLTEADDVTNDMLVGFKNAYEKHAWMLRAYLK